MSGVKGRSGRKRKPTHLRLIDGNAGSRPINVDEPVPDGNIDKPPEGFNARQIRIWNEALASSPPGMLKLIDTSVMAIWVIAYDNWQTAFEAVNRLGQMVQGPKGKGAMANPYLKIQDRQAEIMRKAASDLGFTPTCRTRIHMPGGGKSVGKQNAFANNGRRPD